MLIGVLVLVVGCVGFEFMINWLRVNCFISWVNGFEILNLGWVMGFEFMIFGIIIWDFN